jgi:hypothetical protein
MLTDFRHHLNAVHPGHGYIKDNHVRQLFGQPGKQLKAISGFSNNLHSRVLGKNTFNALSDQAMVISYNYFI